MAPRNNSLPKKNQTPPITDPKLIAKRERQREATRKCRKNKTEELSILEARKKEAVQENEKLKCQIQEIQKLIQWMERAIAARQQPHAFQ